MGFLLLIIIATIGFIVKNDRKNKFDFLIAFILMTGLIFIGVITNTLLMIVSNSINDKTNLISFANSTFTLIFTGAVIVGIILYLFINILLKKVNISMTALTIIEYYIQWSLIYITVYQIIFDNLFDKEIVSKVGEFNIASPQELIVSIFPSLISVWISIILYKYKVKEI